mmetsp:Transcript_77927/g.223755  ORF Transcript_77927/g.223755 Transcript_77927/m.223755 type:complete len:231 (+) Transcript_77927:177-869(+)
MRPARVYFFFALREKIDASSPDFDPPAPFAGGAWADSRRGPFARGALAPCPAIPGSAIPASPSAPAAFVFALPLRPLPFFGPLNFDITSSGFSRRSFFVILSTALRPFFIVDVFFFFSPSAAFCLLAFSAMRRFFSFWFLALSNARVNPSTRSPKKSSHATFLGSSAKSIRVSSKNFTTLSYCFPSSLITPVACCKNGSITSANVSPSNGVLRAAAACVSISVSIFFMPL